MSVDRGVGLPVDGAGKVVRTLEITALDATGAEATFQMQVIQIADEDGKLVDLRDNSELLHLILAELQELVFLTRFKL